MNAVPYYRNHPELDKGEVFFKNIFPIASCPDMPKEEAIAYSLGSIRCPGLRLGEVAYDANGGVLSGGFPVFVRRKALLADAQIVAISKDGEVVHASEMHSNVMRNILDSRAAVRARKSAQYKCHF